MFIWPIFCVIVVGDLEGGSCEAGMADRAGGNCDAGICPWRVDGDESRDECDEWTPLKSAGGFSVAVWGLVAICGGIPLGIFCCAMFVTLSHEILASSKTMGSKINNFIEFRE
jgi:hypothetical protein